MPSGSILTGMAFNWDRWTTRLWFINGVFVLPIAVIGCVMLVVAMVSETGWFHRPAGVVPTTDTMGVVDSLAPRAVRYGNPVTVWGTPVRLIRVQFGEAYARSGAGLGAGYASYARRDYDGPTVNVMFLDGPDGPGRLLLDRAAYIRRLSHPADRSDSLLTWISYEIALTDTDRDGRLDEDDSAELYISDLHGRNLRRVLPAGWHAVDYEPLTRGRLLILALEPPADGQHLPEDERRQRAFVYDIRSGALSQHGTVDSLGDRAGRIVGRP